ncbi:expressed protein [Echinococcus multilocularis]|uniref:Expressed protein n=1 Tax=Echinococcus multilocularis TaxID=6211 RepID=A0A087W1Y5_ECHMU|nr:expressed protein [Echinococcus multilocularis]
MSTHTDDRSEVLICHSSDIEQARNTMFRTGTYVGLMRSKRKILTIIMGIRRGKETNKCSNSFSPQNVRSEGI